MTSSSSVGSPILYRERVWPSVGVVAFSLLMTLSTGVAAAHFYGFTFGLMLGVSLSLVLVIGQLVSSAEITVSESGLRVGAANLPIEYVGPTEVLGAQLTRTRLGVEGRADTFRVCKGWITTSLFVENLDTTDPYRAWHISSRKPQEISKALDLVKRRF